MPVTDLTTYPTQPSRTTAFGLTGNGGPARFLNLSALQVPCAFNASKKCIPGTQHFGNVGRNAFIGPNYKNLDFSVVKNNQLTERLAMQLRVDVFNLFNHPNLANP